RQWQQPDLFAAPFENLPLRQALEFYRHEKGWSNRLVAGDSLLVMNSLLSKESMGGRVQMIYMDPPYGIKYGSNFQPFVNKRDVKDRADSDLTQEPEMIKAFRDTWELGIHSYLTYLRDRLLLARELLSESGSVFVQIGDENVHRVRAVMDEVFGEENFVSLLSYRSSVPLGATYIPGVMTYILMYAKARNHMKFRRLFSERDPKEETRYAFIENSNGHYARMTVSQRKEVEYVAKTSRLFVAENLNSAGRTESCMFPFNFQGSEYMSTQGKSWKTNFDGMKRLTLASRILSPAGNLNYKLYLNDYPVREFTNVWMDTQGASDKTYVVQTSNKVIQRCLLMTTDPGDLVLDPTCGSGTTAYVAEKWGRRWITCDTSRVAITLAKQRLMTASFDYYTLRDPQEGLRGGFNYETVPHITLKSIANNPEIDTIYEEDHPKIAAALTNLNAAMTATPPQPFQPTQGVRKGKLVSFGDGETLHEWEVPFDWTEDWPAAARDPFETFHKARAAMQRRMD
ncbi:MAG: DNA methylase, partial [Candidatus Synechococcus spongiarum 142]